MKALSVMTAMVLATVFVAAGCVIHRKSSVWVTSDPEHARFVIRTEGGNEIARGTTPEYLEMPTINFGDCIVYFEQDGYKPATKILPYIEANYWLLKLVGYSDFISVNLIADITYSKNISDNRVQKSIRQKSAQPEENYRIIEKEDLSYINPNSGINVSRLSYRIKVDPPITKDKLRSICEKIILVHSSNINAISFLFYLPDTEVNGVYTAGKVEWAPNGRWEDAESDSPNQFNIVLAKTPSYEKSSLPTSKKKRIFYELIAMEDKGFSATQADHIIADKYGLSVKEVGKIGIEGAVKNWPMPPP